MKGEAADRIRDALRAVIDPELGENIVDLGFIYDIAVSDGKARITMTAITPGCPATGFLKEGAQNAVANVPGVVCVDVTMTFDRRGRRPSSNPPSGPRSASPRLIDRPQVITVEAESKLVVGPGCRRPLAWWSGNRRRWTR